MRFKVRSLPIGLLIPIVSPLRLAALINEAVQGGYRFKREEVTVEPRRVLLFLQALALNIVFKWEADEPSFEYKVFTYQTRLFTRTVDVPKMTWALNDAARGGFEVYFAFKQPTRWMFLFPRETYLFVLRRRTDGANQERTYRFVEYAYRFFTGTLDPAAYEQVLNGNAAQSRHVVSFRDERRVLGPFRQPVAITLFEDQVGPAAAGFHASQQSYLPAAQPQYAPEHQQPQYPQPQYPQPQYPQGGYQAQGPQSQYPQYQQAQYPQQQGFPSGFPQPYAPQEGQNQQPPPPPGWGESAA